MEFNCKYAKATGEIVKSLQVGQSVEEVQHRLQEQGFLPISVRPRGWTGSFGSRKRRSDIKPDDFILFNQQFVALIKAGLPILRSLDLLKAQMKNPVLQRHVSDVRDRVHSGAMLSDALRAQGVFPTVYTASVYAGERSGDLVQVITRYVQYQKTIQTVRKRFLNALIYPAFLIVLSITMTAVVIAYVVPQFASLYAGLNAPLPFATRTLMALSAVIQSNLILIAVALIGGAIVLRLWIGTGNGRSSLDAFKLKAPVVGRLWMMFSMAQLARTLATLLQGGTPLLSALEVARDASGNVVIADSIRSAVVEVREGKPLSESLERTGHFPELALEMIRVGEQTGSVPEMLSHVADFYDEDVDVRSAALLSFVEPLILIFVAIFIALILISLYLPIFSIRATV